MSRQRVYGQTGRTEQIRTGGQYSYHRASKMVQRVSDRKNRKNKEKEREREYPKKSDHMYKVLSFNAHRFKGITVSTNSKRLLDGDLGRGGGALGLLRALPQEERGAEDVGAADDAHEVTVLVHHGEPAPGEGWWGGMGRSRAAEGKR
jgi:hypothetical protein